MLVFSCCLLLLLVGTKLRLVFSQARCLLLLLPLLYHLLDAPCVSSCAYSHLQGRSTV
jgi:hypothetical protein